MTLARGRQILFACMLPPPADVVQAASARVMEELSRLPEAGVEPPPRAPMPETDAGDRPADPPHRSTLSDFDGRRSDNDPMRQLLEDDDWSH